MKCIIGKKIDYDGSQMEPLWACKMFGAKEDSIVAFRGKCNIAREYMIDIEDKEKGERIYSEDMLHFVVEHFDSNSLKLAYARQRLLACIALEILHHKGYEIKREGDDLFYQGKKLSISVASASSISHKIHFGINVKSKYMGLEEMGIEDFEAFMKEICDGYCREIKQIEEDIRKTKPLETR
jgi:hypothetical protein